jgi:hypothetical protein
MSEYNGDRSRFQRLRQASVRRRERARATHAILKQEAAAARHGDRVTEVALEAEERPHRADGA